MALMKNYFFPDFCSRINASLSMGMARFHVSSHDIFLNSPLVSFLSAPVLLEFFLCWSFGIVNFDYMLFGSQFCRLEIVKVEGCFI